MTDLDDLFGNEGILPSQFYANRGERLNEPIKRLALAVLEDAIRCLQKPANGPIHRETRIWADSEQDGPFSFVGVCDVLNIDAGRLRVHLRHWQGKLGNHRRPVLGKAGIRLSVNRHGRRKRLANRTE
jgi:hypothetical protein